MVRLAEVGDGVGHQERLDVVGVGVDRGDQHPDVGVYAAQHQLVAAGGAHPLEQVGVEEGAVAPLGQQPVVRPRRQLLDHLAVGRTGAHARPPEVLEQAALLLGHAARLGGVGDLHALLEAPAAQPRGVGHQSGAQALGQRAQEVALHVVHQQHRAPRLQAPARQVGRQLLGSRQGIGGDFGNAAHATVSRGKVALGIASAPDQAITALSACQGFSRGSQRLV